jgi:hypothetical protein
MKRVSFKELTQDPVRRRVSVLSRARSFHSSQFSSGRLGSPQLSSAQAFARALRNLFRLPTMGMLLRLVLRAAN